MFLKYRDEQNIDLLMRLYNNATIGLTKVYLYIVHWLCKACVLLIPILKQDRRCVYEASIPGSYARLGIQSFGVMMSFNLCIGLVTPPVGLCLLVCNQIGETSLSKTIRTMIPTLIISLVALMLVTFIPQLTQWLPSIL